MFSCIDCPFTSSLEPYYKHIRLWHPKSVFICGQNGCQRTYINIGVLKQHLRSHENMSTAFTCNSIRTIDRHLPIASQAGICSTSNEISVLNSFVEPETCTSINVIEKEYRIFILSLYSDASLDRKKASYVASSTSRIILDTINTIKVLAKPLITKENKTEFDAIITNIFNIFEKSMTEKSMITYLREQDCYKDPISIIVDETVSDTIRNRELILAPKKSITMKMDITFIFKAFFELPGMFRECQLYMETLENDRSDIMSNVIQGTSWKIRKERFGNKMVIPFCLYHDDFEPGNTLGANSGVQALSSFFVHFPTLPPHIATALENIFPIFSCKTAQKKYGLDKILHPIIEELQRIEEEGIILEIADKKIQVFFSLCLLLGDNKALNEMMGITQCFIKNGFCRICSCTVEESKYLCKEDSSKLRTVENYSEELAKDDFKTTGIREECVFNKLPSFNIICCPSVDIMHDLFEGVCHFQMTRIILYYVEANIFTLDDLNNRKSLFDFGIYQIDNKSVDIQIQHLKHGKLKMSASQSLCFTKYFSLMIGDMIPKKDAVWELYTVFVKLLDILMQNSLSQDEVQSINELVEKNHKLYTGIFEVDLKPKHHFMIHYANLIRQIGPLKNMYVLKQEMFHRVLKRYINQSYNRRNLPKSVLIKESLKFASRLLDNRGYTISQFSKEKGNKLLIKPFILKEIKLLLTGEEFKQISYVKEIYFKNILYKVDSVIPLNNFEQHAFYMVVCILKITDTCFKILAQALEIKLFDDHLLCYIVSKSKSCYKLIDFEEMQYFPQNYHKLPCGQIAVRNPAKL